MGFISLIKGFFSGGSFKADKASIEHSEEMIKELSFVVWDRRIKKILRSILSDLKSKKVLLKEIEGDLINSKNLKSSINPTSSYKFSEGVYRKAEKLSIKDIISKLNSINFDNAFAEGNKLDVAKRIKFVDARDSLIELDEVIEGLRKQILS